MSSIKNFDDVSNNPDANAVQNEEVDVVSRQSATSNTASVAGSTRSVKPIEEPERISIASQQSTAQHAQASFTSSKSGVTDILTATNSASTSHSEESTRTEKSWNQFERASYAMSSPSRASRLMVPRQPGSHESSKVALEDITNKDLVNIVQELQKKTKHFELENMVFVHFLQKNDPTVLEGMQDSLQCAQIAHERASISSKRMTLTRGSRRESQLLQSPSFMTQGSTISEKEGGPRINIPQKTDLILREMDEIQESLQSVNRKCHIIRHKLQADLEEMDIRESEIRETIEIFENVFVTGTLEKYTQKNPAEKFARFMEDCFKQNRAIIDKLRLRTSSLKVQYQKLCNQLTQKRLLGENLQEVDFEQLQISNRRLVEKIDKRNLLLIELKKMNGRANLLLSRTKKHLLTKVDAFKEIKETIAFREDLITKLDDECEKVASEVEKTKSEYDKIKSKSENYKVPAVLDYVKTISELGVLRKNLKVWTRRKQIQDMALIASIREMKTATGQTKIPSSWFATETGDGNKSQEFQFKFEREAKKRKHKRKRRTINSHQQ